GPLPLRRAAGVPRARPRGLLLVSQATRDGDDWV
ncbi:MAG: hypothetical protein AVDCRST_MAG32-921, partial [uncultured Nocardioides sp.]